MTNQVTPEPAVEAALEAFYAKCDVDFDALHAVRAALEAAAPHLWEQGAEAGCIYGVEARNPYRSQP